MSTIIFLNTKMIFVLCNECLCRSEEATQIASESVALMQPSENNPKQPHLPDRRSTFQTEEFGLGPQSFTLGGRIAVGLHTELRRCGQRPRRGSWKKTTLSAGYFLQKAGSSEQRHHAPATRTRLSSDDESILPILELVSAARDCCSSRSSSAMRASISCSLLLLRTISSRYRRKK